MKLRKALDKAKDTRESTLGIEEEAEAPQSTPVTKEEGWTPPQYTSSIKYSIDPDVVERNRGVSIYPDAREIERYKILRTRIHQQSKKRKINNIMVTSANRNEGKTVTVINMGLTFARDLEQTVLLVDCDFKGQDIHNYLGIDSKSSLIDYFLDGTPISDLIIWPGVEKLTLISGDRTVYDSSELLSSDMMEKLVQEMGTRYDDRYVIFDCSPILETSEAISMAPMMDGIILVVEAGKTARKDVQKAVSLIPEEKFLGFVLNKTE